jgi:NADPH-dependent 2,4-dienoyl-CoA reductase/sulfur reductase-like enzyme
VRLVVVGGDAAGMTAASHVVRAQTDADVVVVERGPYTSYSMCGIPYLVGGEIDGPERLVVRTPDEFREAGMTVHMGTEAVAIDAAARTVRVRDAQHRERDEPYDALLWAAGAHPVVPPLPGAAEHGLVVHTLDEGERLRGVLDARPGIRHVVVVGAGYIGMELAEALVRRQLDVTLLDMAPQVMGSLDPDMADHVQRALERFGIRVRLGEVLLAIREPAGQCREVVTDRGAYRAELVVLAVGARPSVDVPAAAGCEVGVSGALRVDDRMRTTVPGIWAAGDCVEARHLVSGAEVNIQLGTHANKQGKVAGIDIVAAVDDPASRRGDAAFPGVVGTAVTKVCELEIARTGLNESQAQAAGLEYRAVRFTSTARSGYMADPGRVHVKMLAEAGTGRLLGAQLVGTGNVAKRIDVAATWCQVGLTVQQAQLLDLAYSPPFGSVWDVLQVGARKLARELRLSPVL